MAGMSETAIEACTQATDMRTSAKQSEADEVEVKDLLSHRNGLVVLCVRPSLERLAPDDMECKAHDRIALACRTGCGRAALHRASRPQGQIARPRQRQSGRKERYAHQDIFCFPTQIAILSQRRARRVEPCPARLDRNEGISKRSRCRRSTRQSRAGWELRNRNGELLYGDDGSLSTM